MRQTGNSYFRDFSTGSENPISEKGRWVNGKLSAVDWQNCEVSSGSIHGDTNGTNSNACMADINCTDPTCLLTGTWGPDQDITVVVKNSVPHTHPDSEEAECRLRTRFSPHRHVGYELMWSLTNNHYIDLERWDFDGVNQRFHDLKFIADDGAVADGDTLRCTMIGTVITGYRNGTQRITYDTSTGNDGGTPGMADSIQYSTGNPGVGFFLRNFPGSTYVEYGIESAMPGVPPSLPVDVS